MKCILTILAAAGVSLAATVDFSTGQAARLVIGQPEFDAESGSATATIVGAAAGLAYANNTLFVADSNRVGAAPVNNRVLIFNNLSGQIPAPTDELVFNKLCPACVGTANVVLGQPDFTTTIPAPCINPPPTTTTTPPPCPANAPATPTATGMRTPTAVASDGIHLVVADTDNNRVLIWNRIPVSNQHPPDVVVGQADFTHATLPPNSTPTASSLRGPQGVWIQNGKLFVADTQNNRVLIYNSIPASNGAAADVVLGQPNFTTYVQINIAAQKTDAAANNMLDPVAVTSDGQHLFVADLGYNRVLIWNSLPTTNQQPADVVIGQPNVTSSIPNNSFSINSNGVESQVLCAPTGKDSNNNPTFPPLCNATLSFPRYALSDGTRLFLADGGNDRVLIFKTVPTSNGAAADYVIGQIGGGVDQASSAADAMQTPLSLAWDGANLYVADSFNQRILVFTPAEQDLAYAAVKNAASLNIYALGTVTFGGKVVAKDTVTVTIQGKGYTYTIQTGDDFTAVVNGLVALINAGDGDPNALATPNVVTQAVLLTARAPGSAGNLVTLAASVSSSAQITATASFAGLIGGGNSASIAPGTLVTILGNNLSDVTMAADPTQNTLPYKMGGVEVYFNGTLAPLLYVSPNQINAQVAFSFNNTTTVNAWVRVEHADGSLTATNPEAVNIVPANPGLFTLPSTLPDPRPGLALHGSTNAAGTVSVDGIVQAGDVGTVKINGRSYSYTVLSTDTLATVRDALIAKINQDPQVTAIAASAFTRILLRARVTGLAGDGIPYSVSVNSGAKLALTATSSALCCASSSGGLVTAASPAIPGETLLVYATGVGLPNLTSSVLPFVVTGKKYMGPADNTPMNSVSSLAGGRTANVLSAGLKPGLIGVYEVLLELSASIPTDPLTQLTIAQNAFVSNIVTFPVVATSLVTSLSCNPVSLTSNGTTNCTVTLNIAPPSGGAMVALSSSNALLTVPASVTVDAGTLTASFTATAGKVPSSQMATITATLNGSKQTAAITLGP